MKQNYFKYTLIGLILILGWFIVNGLWMFVNAFFGAFTVFVLVHGQITYLTEKRKMKGMLAAVIILLEVIVCVFVPMYFLVWALVARIQDINLDITQLIETVKLFIKLVQAKTGYDLLSVGNIETATGYLTKGLQFVIGQAGSILITVIVMIFLLYFMLISRKEMNQFVYGLLPFSDENKRTVMKKIYNIVRSNAMGIPVLILLQGILAMTGYWAAGVPSFTLFGVVSGMVTIIPFIGSTIIWIPLVVYLALTGNWIAAIGLSAYGLIILVNVDNVVRFLLQKKLNDTHPLITVFGVILGLKLFGFWGLIFGPLLLSMFFLLIHIFKEEYLNKDL